MRQLRFVLPTLQLLAAIALLQSGYRATGPRGLDTAYAPTSLFVCFGINAPAIPFKALALLFPERTDQPAPIFFGFSPADGFFLAGVVVVWFLVGRALDRRKSSKIAAVQAPSGAIALRLFLLLPVIWGCALLHMGVRVLHSPGRWNNYLGNVVEGTLFIAWSLLLIIRPILKLFHQPRAQKPENNATA